MGTEADVGKQIATISPRVTPACSAAADPTTSPPGCPYPHPPHPGDANVEGLDAQIEVAQNEERLLEQVEAALGRIEAGTFGNCQECGREISRERLDAVPYARLCIECARKHDRERPS